MNLDDAIPWLCFITLLAAFVFSMVSFRRTADLCSRYEWVVRELYRLKQRLEAREAGTKDAAPAKPAQASPLPPSLSHAPPRSAPALAAMANPAFPVEASQVPVREEITPAPANLEAFLGRKLFAWIGGIALFFAVALFVQYSFKNGLVSPEVRVALGYAVGAAALTAGLLLPRPRYETGVHALASAGLLAFCATTWTAHTLYHFIGQTFAFALFTLATAVGFLLAVRLRSQVVAVLGLLAGFLTPVLASSGMDRPLALFLYIGLLNAGIVAVVLKQPRWPHLIALGWAGTFLHQLYWMVMLVDRVPAWHGFLLFLAFAALFCGALFLLERRAPETRGATPRVWSCVAALGSLGAAFLFGFVDLISGFRDGLSPAAFLGHVFASDVLLLATTWRLGKVWRPASLVSLFVVVLLLAIWMGSTLKPEQLGWALAASVLVAVLHTGYHIAFERRHGSAHPGALSHLAPVLVLVSLLIPMDRAIESPFMLWITVGLIVLVSAGAAVFSGSVLAVCATIVMALFVGGGWLITAPPSSLSTMEVWLMTAGFGALFSGLSLWLSPRILSRIESLPQTEESIGGGWEGPLNPRIVLPAVSAGFPFFLAYVVIERLSLPDPSSVFGVMLVLALLLLGVASRSGPSILAPLALGAVFLGEVRWHAKHLNEVGSLGSPMVVLMWHAGLALLFAAFPFVFKRALAQWRLPWIAAAGALPLHFLLVYSLVRTVWPGGHMWLVPALFSVPSLLFLALVSRTPALDGRMRRHCQALFGGTALLFITLIFPIQFEKEWLTLAWAMEAAALLWLFRRLGENWLRWAAVGLFAVAFLRLTLNPAVLGYHERSSGVLFNGITYTYAIAVAAFSVGAWFARAPHHRWMGRNLGGWLAGLAVTLGFVMMNLLIAHAFSPGRVLEFDFRAVFARDMTCSIAWALYASGILAAGFRCKLRVARFAGLGLLCVTILKLFLYDLWDLGGLYRVGSFIGLAVVLIGVSFVYQRFFSAGGENGSGTPENPPANDLP